MTKLPPCSATANLLEDRRSLAGPPTSPSADRLDSASTARSLRRLRRSTADAVRRTLLGCALVWSLLAGRPAAAQPNAAPPAPPAGPARVREIFVPLADLNVLLEADLERVFLTRDEYEGLLAKARRAPDDPPPPAPGALLSAEYDVTLEEGRASIRGRLAIELLTKGLQALPLELSGVGLRRATLDGRPAPLARDAQGRVLLLTEGLGRKSLELELTAPLETSAALQSLQIKLPRPAAVLWRLVAPGNVEVKSGADVLRRSVDGGATRFELLPRSDGPLVLTLNNRQLLQQRVVVARSVLIDEMTQAYERLHAGFSLAILRGAVDRFEFELPVGFEVTEVETPLLAKWEVAEPPADGGPDARRTLTVVLREPTTEPVRINVTAARLAPPLDDWRLPRFQPLDVAGHGAVVGLLVDERLKFESLSATKLIGIDADSLTAALPASVLTADPSAPRIRPAAAFYAAESDFGLSARFSPPPPRLNVVSNVLLLLDEGRQAVRAGFELRPEVERLFHLELSIPAAWRVEKATGPDGASVPFESFPLDADRRRIRIELPTPIEPGTVGRVGVEATATPDGWIGDWADGRMEVAFPACRVLGASRDEGALAVHAGDDLEVRPGADATFRNVTPLDANERARFGLADVATDLVYRYEGADYAAGFTARRSRPLLTARSYSFLKIEAENLTAHYEVKFDVQRAAVQRVALLLPESTPQTIVIRGLGGAVVKEYSADPPGAGAPDGWRRWNVLLAERVRDTIRLAVDFRADLPDGPIEGRPLPVIRTDDGQVAYQSGLVAVEGGAELDVDVQADATGPGRPKKVDVGELAEADYVVGRRLLAAYGFVGPTPDVSVDVVRRPGYALPGALVQRAELLTVVARSGRTQTAARYQFRTKELFIELQLPAGATLWSAYLDGRPLAPQRAGQSLLLSLTAASANRLRDVQVVYEAPIRAFELRGRVALTAPVLRLRNEAGESGREIDLADLQWQVVLPSGYRLTQSGGSVFPDLADPVTQRQLALRRSPWIDLAGAPFAIAAGLGEAMLPARRYYDELAAAPAYDAPKSEAPTAYGFAAPADNMSGVENAPMADFADLAAGGAPGGGGLPPGVGGPGRLGLKQNEFAEGAGGMAPPAAAREQLARDEAPQSEASAATSAPVPPASPGLDGRAGLESRTFQNYRAKSESGAKGAVRSELDLAKAPEVDAKGRAEGGDSAEGREGFDRFQERGATAVDRTVATVWALEGVRSLPIEFGQYLSDGRAEVATFRSLGVAPRLDAVLVHRSRLRTIAWAAALSLFFYGLVSTHRPAGWKSRLIVGVLILATVAPLVGYSVHETATIADHLFWAAVALAGWYLLFALTRRIARIRIGDPRAAIVARWRSRGKNRGAVATSIAIGLALAIGGGERAEGQEGPPAEAVKKVTVPADAIVVPYDADDPDGVRKASRILVPLAKYRELWNLAHPEREPAAQRNAKLPAAYAWSGARYETRLDGADTLTLVGVLDLELFASGAIDVPLPLAGGVLTDAKLDGRPASLRLLAPEAPPQAPPAQQARPAANVAPPAAPPVLALAVQGPGRRTLTLTIGMRLQRRGGWRAAEGRLPSAPSAELVLNVPDARTEVRLGDVFDRSRWESQAPGERLTTSLDPAGVLNLQWRPKVAEAEVDKSLTASSKGDVEFREDVVRVVWQTDLEFPRSRRETFSFSLPADYLLERVLGDNVRSWNLVVDGDRQRLDVVLLKTAVDRESLAIVASKRGRAGEGAAGEFSLPTVDVLGAALHQGVLALARSPWLDVRLEEVGGLERTDLPAMRISETLGARDESPLGVQPFQAFKFAQAGFSARIKIRPVDSAPRAVLRSVWKIDPREMPWETQLSLHPSNRPVYQARLRIPDELVVDAVVAPSMYDWSVVKNAEGRTLTVYLTAASMSGAEVLIRGRLPAPKLDAPLPIPHVGALDVVFQESYVVVQVDPSVDATVEGLKNVESVLLSRTFGWLGEAQRPLARLALNSRSAVYSGFLKIVRREPRVTAGSVTNIRVTGRSIEETVLVDFRIEEAGVRRVEFLLPASLRDARITAPLLREKTITDEPATAGRPARIRVRLDLQDAVMGSFRVLVEHERLLTVDTQEAPVPTIETGRTEQRLIAVESTGRDELEFDDPVEIETLTPQQQAWSRLVQLFGKNLLAGYQVGPEAREPRLTYRTRERQVVETVGARIGLAETQFEFDANGAYRARQTYRVDNGTEQFLVVEMPPGATLWTAVVAGEPVKPQQPPAGSSGQVRVPLVKTAPGDLDYAVELTYGGRIERPGAWGRLKFPLVKTVNVNVELSRVRLLLPASHRWFQFGGTLGRVDERGQFEAGYLEYQTKQLSRLSELLRAKSEDDLQRLRVTSNLKNLNESLKGYAQGQQGLLTNDVYARNLSNFNSVLSQTEEQLVAETAQLEQRFDKSQQVGNRDQLNAYFNEQQAQRAVNVVGQLGDNFSAASSGPTSGRPATGNPFNGRWFAANGFDAAAAKDKTRIMDQEAQAGKRDGRPAAQPQQAGAAQNADLRKQLQELNDEKPGSRRSSGRAVDGEQERVLRYQQRLDRQSNLAPNEPGLPADGGAAVPAPVVAPGTAPDSALPDPVKRGESAGEKLAESIAMASDLDGGAAVPTGLASLTIELPARGDEYLFMTPRGDLEITAYAIDVDLLGRLLRLAVVAGALVVVGAGLKVGRRLLR